jgi:multiple sugar transport system substrate-binding protein
MLKQLKLLAGATLALGLMAGTASAQVLFWSTQAAPVEETAKMRDNVLAGFPGGVDFQPQEIAPFITRLEAEIAAGSGDIGVVGALHGDLSTYADAWADLSDIDLSGVNVSPAFLELGKLGSGEQKYLPWMQANYVMAANKQALEHLPDGADINALTYDQLIAWCAALSTETGSPKCGFPAGPQGLKHRFFQGFLLPAYTGSMVTKFRSAEAEQAWTKFRELWQHVNPAATNYNFMQEPLLTGEVWVAFDHIARLADAFNQQPDNFVAFPVPAGPMGRAFMPVLAGLAVPSTAPDVAQAKELVKYMMQPEQQVATLLATNFYPVTDAALPTELPASARALGPAITAQTTAADALPALLPIGLKDQGGAFNQVYTDTFERIVLGGQDIRQVLDQQAEALRGVINGVAAPCWLPDAASDGPCPIE